MSTDNWIATETALPAINQMVLTYRNTSEYHVAWLNGMGYWHSFKDSQIIYAPTHWQALTKPGEETK